MSDTRSLKKFLQGKTREEVPSPTSEGRVRVFKVTRTGWTYGEAGRVLTMEFKHMKSDQISKVISA